MIWFQKAKRRLIIFYLWMIWSCMLVMEKRKIVKSVGIELPDGKVIKSLQEGESYKYLGILETFLEEKMKLNVSKEYIRLRQALKSKNWMVGI